MSPPLANYDDDFAVDADMLAALAAAESRASASAGPRPPGPRPVAEPTSQHVVQPTPQRIVQPTPQRIVQPTPQRLDRPPAAASSAGAGGTKVVQPTPQALPGGVVTGAPGTKGPVKPSSGSTIQVSPRQKGNPVLASIKSLPWEYSDIPADYVLGVTTCALFLSLKYHRLHPEYIYTRIRGLQGKYQLRILLTMVDIPNHEDPLRELSKTSLINNVTVILCWSAAEAARYLELYKSYEHAGFSAIRGQQAKSYAERLVEFVTVPRGINKADAVALVSAFGTLRNAINADPEQVGLVAGWGEKKVQRWCAVVREPFRVQTAAARTITKTTAEGTKDDQGRGASKLEQAVPLGRVPKRDMPAASSTPSKAAAPSATAQTRQYQIYDPDIDDEDEDEDAMLAAAIEESRRTAQPTGAAGASAPSSSKPAASGSGSAYEMPDGVAAALAKLRQSNG